MDISVIVPIYNVEKYIEKCLRSLFEQTKTDGVEFILVNDCAPDGSMDIVRKVICEYPHLTIKVLEHAENRGVAATRQTGLDAAIGDYTIQIDSDDWCEPTMLEEMYAKAIEDSADIVACDMFNYENKHVRNVHSKDKLDNIDKLIFGLDIFSALWTKLIKRDLFINNGIRCNNGINHGEDLIIMPMLYYVANKVSYLPHAYIHYTFNPKSLTKNSNISNDINFTKSVIYIWEPFFKATPDYLRLRSSIDNRKLFQKHKILRLSRGKEQREYNKLFTISNGTIFRSKIIAFPAKITLLFANIGLLPISNLLHELRYKLHGRK